SSSPPNRITPTRCRVIVSREDGEGFLFRSKTYRSFERSLIVCAIRDDKQPVETRSPKLSGVVVSLQEASVSHRATATIRYSFSQTLPSSASFAASTSAACLLEPVPRPRALPSHRTSTTNVFACSGPVAEITSYVGPRLALL